MEASTPDAVSFVAYSAWGYAVRIVPAWKERDWMGENTGFAYHCLPMLLANQSGWFVLAPHDATATWNGGPKRDDVVISLPEGTEAPQAMSQVGTGIMTWTIPYLFRTPPGWNLLCRGPSNWIKDGIAPLEGLVETDWSEASFSMNWRFTRPGTVSFAAGEPIAMLVPQQRRELESLSTRMVPLATNPDLMAGYSRWIHERMAFWKRQESGDVAAIAQKFQRHYQQGKTNAGVEFPDHQKSRSLGTFDPPA